MALDHSSVTPWISYLDKNNNFSFFCIETSIISVKCHFNNVDNNIYKYESSTLCHFRKEEYLVSEKHIISHSILKIILRLILVTSLNIKKINSEFP